MKAIIFDASTIINLSMNSLLDLLKELKKLFGGKFLITEQVEYEVIKRPLQIKKYELSALKVQQLLTEGVIEMLPQKEIDSTILNEKTREILDIANKTFTVRNRDIHLIDIGEASCLALSKLLTEKGVKNILAIDERTTRMLCEGPENIQKIFENKLNTKIKVKKENFNEFNEFKVIRSAELLYIAYKNKLIDMGNGMLLDALLYASKYKGCSISKSEIETMKKM